MALVLQEILTSDTPANLYTKLNYNFDQIYLNSPSLQIVRGEKGTQGEQGISGLNGATWFNGSGDPSLLPSTSFFRSVIPGDYYLDLDSGFVWYYDPELTIPAWTNTNFTLKGDAGTSTQIGSETYFQLSTFADSPSKGLNLKADLNGVNKVSLFVTQDPNRLTSDLTNANLIVSKPNLTASNIILTVDGINSTNQWGVIDIQRPFIGVNEKTQMVLSSELLLLNSTDRITLSPGISGYVEIESGRLQFPTTLNNEESDVTVTGSELRIRGKRIASIKQILLEDRVSIKGDLSLTGQRIVFPTTDNLQPNENVILRKTQSGSNVELQISLGDDYGTTAGGLDRLVIGGLNASNIFTSVASINANGDAIFKNLNLSGPFVSSVTPVLGSVTAGAGLTGGGTSPITGGNVTISHSDTSNIDNISYIGSGIDGAGENNTLGGTVINSLNFDTYGHATGFATKNLDLRYYKKSEVNSLNDEYFKKQQMVLAYQNRKYPGANSNLALNGGIINFSDPENHAIPNITGVRYLRNGAASNTLNLGSLTIPNSLIIPGVSSYTLLVNFTGYFALGDDLTCPFFISTNISEVPNNKPLIPSTGGVSSESSSAILSGSFEFIVNSGQTINLYLHYWLTFESFRANNGTATTSIAISGTNTTYSLSPRTIS